MELELTPQQYRKLVELAYLGEWMVNAHHDVDYEDEAATATLQALLSAAPLEEVGQDDETGNYYLQTQWSEQLYDTYVFDYDDHVFWEELIERMAQRDFARSQGMEADDISRDDHLPALRQIEERYRAEFEDHGVDHLALDKYA